MFKSYKQAVQEIEDKYLRDRKNVKGHKEFFGITNKHAKALLKSHKEMLINTYFYEASPSIDVDIHLGKNNAFADVYPFIDALIKDKRLEMTLPLPAKVESKETTVVCAFEKKTKRSFRPKIRVYIYLENSQVCINVGTGKYKEITRVACGHYDEGGNFVEDTNEDNQ